MKLAVALSERADLQRKLSELAERLNNNARVQEGEKPAEQPEELLREFDDALARLETLIVQINLTNSRTLSDGYTLTELLAKRDCLKRRVHVMRNFLDQASRKTERYSNSEIRIFSTVPVAVLQKQVDDASGKLRKVDEAIQELNWTTELLELENKT